MIAFRVTTEKFSKQPYLLNGEGGLVHPGRWHFRGTKTVYCAESLDTALSEKGYHTIVLPAREINFQHKGKSKPPKARIEKLLRRELVISELGIQLDDSKFVDISTPGKLARWSSKLGVPLTFEQALVDNPFYTDQTCTFGSAVHGEGRIGLITQSARHDGRCMVLFPDHLDTEREIAIADQQNLRVSCLPTEYAGRYDIKKDGPLAEDRILIDLQGDSTTPVWLERIVPIHWH